MKKLLLFLGVVIALSPIGACADEKEVSAASPSVLPIIFRHDGYSLYCGLTPPIDRAFVEREMIDVFEGTNVKIYAWGLNAGGKASYDSQIVEYFGQGATDEELKTQTPDNQMTYWNLKGLIESGNCPLKIATERTRELGMKIWARFAVSEEFPWPGCYDDGREDSQWAWAGVTLTSNFTKSNPQYRIPRGIRLDFKHPQVREWKMKFFLEAAERDVDGLYLDFGVHPPYFEKPDHTIMTDFVRTLRHKLNEISERTGRRREFVVRVPSRGYMEMGLDWKTWMKEGLIDGITPHLRRDGDAFIPDAREMVAFGQRYHCPVYGTLWHILALTSPDPRPDGKIRYDKHKTREMFNAQSLLYHYWGVDGLEIATWGPRDWTHARPWYNELSDRNKIEYANKHYMVDPDPWFPVLFRGDDSAPNRKIVKEVELCIADNIPKAEKEGYAPEVNVFLYMRPLEASEKLQLLVNGQGPVAVTFENLTDPEASSPVNMAKEGRFGGFIFEKEWYNRGEHKIPVNADWLKQGDNVLTLAYTASESNTPELRIAFIDVKIDYKSDR